MIGRQSSQRHRQWLQAIAVSVALHGAAIAGIAYNPAPRSLSEPVQDFLTNAVEVLPLSEAMPTGPDQSVDPPAMPMPKPPAAEPPLILAGNESWQVVARPMPTLPPSETDTLTPAGRPTAEPAPEYDAPPPDPRLAGLLDEIRGRLDQSCLLALPQLLADDSLRLSVLAADDRQIIELITNTTERIGTEIPDRRILLDQRQCPALSFARRSRSYPLFGLSLHLQSDDITSGGTLVGRIVNGAGYYNTLLLVDDNGVVQDLRRFLIMRGGEVGFDVPMARDGAARDTHQLLIAIATRDRIAIVTPNAGRLAADFFPALIAELGEDALIGVGSIYIR